MADEFKPLIVVGFNSRGDLVPVEIQEEYIRFDEIEVSRTIPPFLIPRKKDEGNDDGR